MARKTVRREKTGARDTIDGDPQQIEKETKGKNKFDTTARRPSNTAPVEALAIWRRGQQSQTAV